MELALPADFAIVKAWKGDRMGNLVFRKTTRNFSSSMARAGNVTIAEAEELVEPGQLDPDEIHVPGIYVHRIFQGMIMKNASKGKPSKSDSRYGTR